MVLTRRSLKGLIEFSDLRNVDGVYTKDDVIGVSTDKCMISTKADLDGVNLLNYKLFSPGCFAFVADTSRRGGEIALGNNNTEQTFIVSTWYVVFRVCDEAKDIISSDYLYMYFNRAEFDRYARFNSWGSAREYFWFSDMENVILEIPPLAVQKKYVDVYNSMLANQRNYERGLEDLRLVCDSYIEKLKRQIPCKKIGTYLEESDRRNDIGLTVEAVRGLATSKEMILTKADMEGVRLSNYKVVLPKQIAYVPDTSRRGDKVSLGFNGTDETFLVSSISIVFGTKLDKLLPEYLMLFLTRSDFDRYARFHSWGSARETFNFDDMCAVEIPIPDTKIQQYIVNIYIAYQLRKEINEQLKMQIRDICPVLIKGSLEEVVTQGG